MEEIGIDMSVHTPHTMDELIANRFDLVVTLSADAPEAVARRGLEMGAIEHWPMPDPTLVEGNREAVLSAYRTLRDTLQQKVRARLEPLGGLCGCGGSQSRTTASIGSSQFGPGIVAFQATFSGQDHDAPHAKIRVLGGDKVLCDDALRPDQGPHHRPLQVRRRHGQPSGTDPGLGLAAPPRAAQPDRHRARASGAGPCRRDARKGRTAAQARRSASPTTRP